MVKRCVICDEPLTSQNESKEHIIHNALGGSLENNGIYCKPCNELYGSDQDKSFTQIFAPIVDGIDIHKSRKTKGTPYTGVMYDKDGNLYTATYKSGKVVKLEDCDSKYVKYEKDKFTTLHHHFKLENNAFKLGISKIAFNYAIHCGLPSNCLERVFDYTTKKLISKPVVIPFMPMTVFDTIMEMHPVDRIFHAVRIFNNECCLYAYVELFNTFQHYILLSEKYNFGKFGNIDKSYGNIVEINEPLDENLLASVTPKDYKDADIIRNQYHIDVDELIQTLKKYHSYDSTDRFEQTNMLFVHIGKRAYDKIRTQPYIKEYKEIINHHYDSIDFSNELFLSEGIEKMSRFYSDFQFYTIYDDDCVNTGKYKKMLPDGSDYPLAICKILASGHDLGHYGHMKFDMLINGSY